MRRAGPGTPLRGEIESGLLGPVSVGRVKTSTPHSVYRTPGLIRRESPELYRVAMAMSGSVLLQQDGRAAQLRRGEFTIYDFTRPYELTYDSAVQLAVFSFPRDMLALPLDLVAGLTCVPVSAAGGAGALAAPLLRRVALDLESYLPVSAARLSTVVMNLVTTAVAERADHTDLLSAEMREGTLLLRIHAFIDGHLSDADLDPGTVAHVGPGAPGLPHDFATQLGDLVTAGRRAEAATLFLVQAAEVPAETVTAMRAQPSWPEVEAIAHTLSYEAA